MIKQLYRFLSPRFQNLFLDYKVKMKPRYGHGQPPHPTLFKIIDGGREQYSHMVNRILAQKERLWTIRQNGVETNPKAPIWNNGFLPGLDIAALYTMLAELRPKNYIEVGSGNSTKVAFKAKQDLNLSTHITSIDPLPRVEIDQLADTVIRKPFEQSGIDLAEALNAGDILFIDNSHRILPNSDAMVFFMETLPRLKKGVVVHIHDIYLPYDYPQFMCDRAYSEQYGLAAFLLANPRKFQTSFPCYFVSEDPALSAQLAPLWQHQQLNKVEKHGGSFWLTIDE